MKDSSKILLKEFYEKHPIIYSQDWMDQRQVITFMGNNYDTNRMFLWRHQRKEEPITTLTLCPNDTGKNAKILYLRKEVEDLVKKIAIKNGKYNALEFEKKKLTAVKYYVSTKDFIPTCWMFKLSEGYFKKRMKYYLTSKLDHQIIKSKKVFNMDWYNVKDIVYYIIEGNSIPMRTEITNIGLGINVHELQKLVDK